MKTWNEIINFLHTEAMERASHAVVLIQAGWPAPPTKTLEQAFALERIAAIMASRGDEEPTRSVLLRSAASLAIQCGDPHDALHLIVLGLHGNPPREIELELWELYKTAKAMQG